MRLKSIIIDIFFKARTAGASPPGGVVERSNADDALLANAEHADRLYQEAKTRLAEQRSHFPSLDDVIRRAEEDGVLDPKSRIPGSAVHLMSALHRGAAAERDLLALKPDWTWPTEEHIAADERRTVEREAAVQAGGA